MQEAMEENCTLDWVSARCNIIRRQPVKLRFHGTHDHSQISGMCFSLLNMYDERVPGPFSGVSSRDC